MTSNVTSVHPFQVSVAAEESGLERDSKAQAEQVRAISVERVGNLVGAVPAYLMLQVDAADHVLFASDCPFDPEKGPGFIRETIRVLDNLDVTDAVRAKIYEGNAKRMLRLQL